MVLEESSSSVTGDRASGASAALNQSISGMAHAHVETFQSNPVAPAATIELLKAANMWSQGTELHWTDNCHPCRHIHMPHGCKDGIACNFCHAPHTSCAQRRPGKNRRQRCKRLADIAQELQMNVNPEMLGNHSSYMGRLLKAEKIGDETRPRAKKLDHALKHTNARCGRCYRRCGGFCCLCVFHRSCTWRRLIWSC